MRSDIILDMPRLIHRSAMSWNDILLVPQYSDIRSRLDTDLRTRLTKTIYLDHPICSTNMMTVTDFQMMQIMHKTGGCGFPHRFMPKANLLSLTRSARDCYISPLVISIGVKDEDRDYINSLDDKDCPDVFLIDVAHGDCISVVEMIKYVKDRSFAQVIAGNIATREGAERLCEAGADALRVGVGGGSVCSTRTVTGHGMPTLQSVIDCHDVAQHYDIPIIADGGFRTSGDIVKALAFGADTVSLGGLLGATSASPGGIFRKEPDGSYSNVPWDSRNSQSLDGLYKRMFGMASKEAQEIRGDGLKAGTAAEGISHYVQYLGETETIVQELLGGIRSGLTYSGSTNIAELRRKAQYIILQSGGIQESKMG